MNDIVLHFLAGFAIAGLLLRFAYPVTFSTFVTTLKELYDSSLPDNHFSFEDLVAGLAGAALINVVIYINERMQRMRKPDIRHG